jgi:hypothetical protein
MASIKEDAGAICGGDQGHVAKPKKAPLKAQAITFEQ